MGRSPHTENTRRSSRPSCCCAAAVGGLSASAAASPRTSARQEPSSVQNARMICNDRPCEDTLRSIATTTRTMSHRAGRMSTADLTETTTKGPGWNCASASAIAGDKSGNSQAQEPAPPGGFFLRQPLLNDPVCHPGITLLKRCGRGDTAPGAHTNRRAEGGDLTLCLLRTGKPRRGYRPRRFPSRNRPVAPGHGSCFSSVRMRA